MAIVRTKDGVFTDNIDEWNHLISVRAPGEPFPQYVMTLPEPTENSRLSSTPQCGEWLNPGYNYFENAPGSIQYYIRKYFPPSQWENAARISYCESSWDPMRHNNNGEDSRGLFQINVQEGANPQYRDENLFDGENNTRIASIIWERWNGWGAWFNCGHAMAVLCDAEFDDKPKPKPGPLIKPPPAPKLPDNLSDELEEILGNIIRQIEEGQKFLANYTNQSIGNVLTITGNLQQDLGTTIVKSFLDLAEGTNKRLQGLTNYLGGSLDDIDKSLGAIISSTGRSFDQIKRDSGTLIGNLETEVKIKISDAIKFGENSVNEAIKLANTINERIGSDLKSIQAGIQKSLDTNIELVKTLANISQDATGLMISSLLGPVPTAFWKAFMEVVIGEDWLDELFKGIKMAQDKIQAGGIS